MGNDIMNLMFKFNQAFFHKKNVDWNFGVKYEEKKIQTFISQPLIDDPKLCFPCLQISTKNIRLMWDSKF